MWNSFKALPIFCDQRTTGGRCDDMCGCLPTELFDQFKAEGFRAFSVERADVMLTNAHGLDPANFTTESIDIVIIAGDTHDCRTINEGCNDLTNLEICGMKMKQFSFAMAACAATALARLPVEAQERCQNRILSLCSRRLLPPDL